MLPSNRIQQGKPTLPMIASMWNLGHAIVSLSLPCPLTYPCVESLEGTGNTNKSHLLKQASLGMGNACQIPILVRCVQAKNLILCGWSLITLYITRTRKVMDGNSFPSLPNIMNPNWQTLIVELWLIMKANLYSGRENNMIESSFPKRR